MEPILNNHAKLLKMKPRIIKQNVGVDMSKDDFKVNFQQLLDSQKIRIKGSRSFKNGLGGFRNFLEWVEKRRDLDAIVRITLEATGVYYEQLVHYLDAQTDYHISVVLGNKTKAYFKSLNLKSKTDGIDAKALGQMGIERDLAQWKPLSKHLHLLKQLTRDRVCLVEQKTALTNRLHALKHSFQPSKSVMKRLRKQVVLLEKQIKAVEYEIEETVCLDEAIQERVDKITKVKGLGLITVATIIAETGGFELFNSRSQLVSYSGYDVVLRESGTSIKGKTRISKKGNKFIRRALYLPSMTIRNYEPSFKQFHDRILEKTNVKKKALTAVQRKMLLLIYTLFKKNEDYNPNYEADKLNKIQEEKMQKNSRQEDVPAYTG